MHFVSLRYFKPLTPAQRWKRAFVSIKNFKTPTKKHSLVLKWTAGRNNKGVKILRTQAKLLYKKKITVTATLLKLNDIFVSTLFYFNFHNETPLVFFKTKKKSSFFLPATTTNQPGLIVYALQHKFELFQKTHIGIPTFLKNVKYYLPICFLSLWPYKKYNYSTASGVFCIKLRASKKEKLLKLVLPSKIVKYLPVNTLAIVGKSKQIWRKKRVVGKAGSLKNKGKNSIVRGIAMNSVDHPQGGKANSSSPEMSPWGWIAKHNK